MERANEKDINTGPWWDEFWTGPRGTWETNPCPDIAPMITALSENRRYYLDIGCGTGRYMPFVRSEFVYGLDISPEAIEVAKKNHPNVRFTAIDIAREGLNFGYETVDMVYCGEVLEHLEEPQRLIDEIRRVLVPGGVVLLNTPFEDIITADAHLWYFKDEDIRKMFSVFSRVSVMRFNNHPKHMWEHFAVVAIK